MQIDIPTINAINAMISEAVAKVKKECYDVISMLEEKIMHMEDRIRVLESGSSGFKLDGEE